MEENQAQNNTPVTESFGITTETNSRNAVSMSGGINKAVLLSVKSEEIGKNEKYRVLNFKFIDLDGIKSFTHTEFIPKGKATTKQTEAQNYETKKNGFNSRVKHIFEAYAPFPTNGLGQGATNWESFFDKIATEFNTLNNGKPVFQYTKEDKQLNIPVWIKNTYTTSGNLQFPMSPNFIERMSPEFTAPRILVIDKKYDITVQPDQNKGGTPNMMGGNTGMHSTNDDLTF